MANYRISGIWKDENGTITHYAFHTVENNGTSRAIKKTKAQAIEIVDTKGNTTYTLLWNYHAANWELGEVVHVVGTGANRYLRSNADKKVTDNLGHLIDFDWIFP